MSYNGGDFKFTDINSLVDFLQKGPMQMEVSLEDLQLSESFQQLVEKMGLDGLLEKLQSAYENTTDMFEGQIANPEEFFSQLVVGNQVSPPPAPKNVESGSHYKSSNPHHMAPAHGDSEYFPEASGSPAASMQGGYALRPLSDGDQEGEDYGINRDIPGLNPYNGPNYSSGLDFTPVDPFVPVQHDEVDDVDRPVDTPDNVTAPSNGGGTPAPESEPQAAPQAQTQPESENAPEVQAQPEPQVEPLNEPEDEQTPPPLPDVQEEPQSEPEPELESYPDPQPEPEPQPEPQDDKDKPGPEPQPDPQYQHDDDCPDNMEGIEVILNNIDRAEGSHFQGPLIVQPGGGAFPLDPNLEDYDGTEGDDKLTGNLLNNTLTGDCGDDLLVGDLRLGSTELHTTDDLNGLPLVFYADYSHHDAQNGYDHSPVAEGIIEVPQLNEISLNDELEGNEGNDHIFGDVQVLDLTFYNVALFAELYGEFDCLPVHFNKKSEGDVIMINDVDVISEHQFVKGPVMGGEDYLLGNEGDDAIRGDFGSIIFTVHVHEANEYYNSFSGLAVKTFKQELGHGHDYEGYGHGEDNWEDEGSWEWLHADCLNGQSLAFLSGIPMFFADDIIYGDNDDLTGSGNDILWGDVEKLIFETVGAPAHGIYTALSASFIGREPSESELGLMVPLFEFGEGEGDPGVHTFGNNSLGFASNEMFGGEGNDTLVGHIGKLHLIARFDPNEEGADEIIYEAISEGISRSVAAVNGNLMKFGHPEKHEGYDEEVNLHPDLIGNYMVGGLDSDIMVGNAKDILLKAFAGDAYAYDNPHEHQHLNNYEGGDSEVIDINELEAPESLMALSEAEIQWNHMQFGNDEMYGDLEDGSGDGVDHMYGDVLDMALHAESGIAFVKGVGDDRDFRAESNANISNNFVKTGDDFMDGAGGNNFMIGDIDTLELSTKSDEAFLEIGNAHQDMMAEPEPEPEPGWEDLPHHEAISSALTQGNNILLGDDEMLAGDGNNTVAGDAREILIKTESGEATVRSVFQGDEKNVAQSHAMNLKNDIEAGDDDIRLGNGNNHVCADIDQLYVEAKAGVATVWSLDPQDDVFELSDESLNNSDALLAYVFAQASFVDNPDNIFMFLPENDIEEFFGNNYQEIFDIILPNVFGDQVGDIFGDLNTLYGADFATFQMNLLSALEAEYGMPQGADLVDELFSVATEVAFQVALEQFIDILGTDLVTAYEEIMGLEMFTTFGMDRAEAIALNADGWYTFGNDVVSAGDGDNTIYGGGAKLHVDAFGGEAYSNNISLAHGVNGQIMIQYGDDFINVGDGNNLVSGDGGEVNLLAKGGKAHVINNATIDEDAQSFLGLITLNANPTPNLISDITEIFGSDFFSHGIDSFKELFEYLEARANGLNEFNSLAFGNDEITTGAGNDEIQGDAHKVEIKSEGGEAHLAGLSLGGLVEAIGRVNENLMEFGEDNIVSGQGNDKIHADAKEVKLLAEGGEAKLGSEESPAESIHSHVLANAEITANEVNFAADTVVAFDNMNFDQGQDDDMIWGDAALLELSALGGSSSLYDSLELISQTIPDDTAFSGLTFETEKVKANALISGNSLNMAYNTLYAGLGNNIVYGNLENLIINAVASENSAKINTETEGATVEARGLVLDNTIDFAGGLILSGSGNDQIFGDAFKVSLLADGGLAEIGDGQDNQVSASAQIDFGNEGGITFGATEIHVEAGNNEIAGDTKEVHLKAEGGQALAGNGDNNAIDGSGSIGRPFLPIQQGLFVDGIDPNFTFEFIPAAVPITFASDEINTGNGMDIVYGDTHKLSLEAFGGSAIGGAGDDIVADADGRIFDVELVTGDDIINTNGGADTIYGDIKDLNIVAVGGMGMLGDEEILSGNLNVDVEGRMQSNTYTFGSDTIDARGTDFYLNTSYDDVVYGDAGNILVRAAGGTGVIKTGLDHHHHDDDIEIPTVDIDAEGLINTQNDFLFGGDTIILGDGNNSAVGGVDHLQFKAEGGSGTIIGVSEFGDVDADSRVEDLKLTFEGDTISSGFGDDEIKGDATKIELHATGGTSIVGGGEDIQSEAKAEIENNDIEFGNDEIDAGDGMNTISGDVKDLHLKAYGGAATIGAGDGVEVDADGKIGFVQDEDDDGGELTESFTFGDDTINTGNGSDLIKGDFDAALFEAKGGTATAGTGQEADVFARAAVNGIEMNTGNDLIEANLGDDTIYGDGNQLSLLATGGTAKMEAGEHYVLDSDESEVNAEAQILDNSLTFGEDDIGATDDDPLNQFSDDDTVYGDMNLIEMKAFGGSAMFLDSRLSDSEVRVDSDAKIENNTLNFGTDKIRLGGGNNTAFGDVNMMVVMAIASMNTSMLGDVSGSSATSVGRFTDHEVSFGHENITAGYGNDTIHADAGMIDVLVQGGSAVIGDGNENIATATAAILSNDFFFGNDTVEILGGDNTVTGDADKIAFKAVAGDATVGNGSDNIASAIADISETDLDFVGEGGRDHITTGDGDDTIYGDARMISYEALGGKTLVGFGNSNAAASWAAVSFSTIAFEGDYIHAGWGDNDIFGDVDSLTLRAVGGMATTSYGSGVSSVAYGQVFSNNLLFGDDEIWGGWHVDIVYGDGKDILLDAQGGMAMSDSQEMQTADASASMTNNKIVAGDDNIWTGTDSDTIWGDFGNLTVNLLGGTATLGGPDQPNDNGTVLATASITNNDTPMVQFGSDMINATGMGDDPADDTVYGDAENVDFILKGGTATLYDDGGDATDHTVDATAEIDSMGSELMVFGDDMIWLGDGNNHAVGDVQNLTMNIMGGTAEVIGILNNSSGDVDAEGRIDSAVFTFGSNTIYSGYGDDKLIGNAGLIDIDVMGGSITIGDATEGDIDADGVILEDVFNFGEDMIESLGGDNHVVGDFQEFDILVTGGSTTHGNGDGNHADTRARFALNAISTTQDTITTGDGDDIVKGDFEKLNIDIMAGPLVMGSGTLDDQSQDADAFTENNNFEFGGAEIKTKAGDDVVFGNGDELSIKLTGGTISPLQGSLTIHGQELLALAEMNNDDFVFAGTLIDVAPHNEGYGHYHDPIYDDDTVYGDINKIDVLVQGGSANLPTTLGSAENTIDAASLIEDNDFEFGGDEIILGYGNNNAWGDAKEISIAAKSSDTPSVMANAMNGDVNTNAEIRDTVAVFGGDSITAKDGNDVVHGDAEKLKMEAQGGSSEITNGNESVAQAKALIESSGYEFGEDIIDLGDGNHTITGAADEVHFIATGGKATVGSGTILEAKAQGEILAGGFESAGDTITTNNGNDTAYLDIRKVLFEANGGEVIAGNTADSSHDADALIDGPGFDFGSDTFTSNSGEKNVWGDVDDFQVRAKGGNASTGINTAMTTDVLVLARITNIDVNLGSDTIETGWDKATVYGGANTITISAEGGTGNSDIVLDDVDIEADARISSLRITSQSNSITTWDKDDFVVGDVNELVVEAKAGSALISGDGNEALHADAETSIEAVIFGVTNDFADDMISVTGNDFFDVDMDHDIVYGDANLISYLAKGGDGTILSSLGSLEMYAESRATIRELTINFGADTIWLGTGHNQAWGDVGTLEIIAGGSDMTAEIGYSNALATRVFAVALVDENSVNFGMDNIMAGRGNDVIHADAQVVDLQSLGGSTISGIAETFVNMDSSATLRESSYIFAADTVAIDGGNNTVTGDAESFNLIAMGGQATLAGATNDADMDASATVNAVTVTFGSESDDGKYIKTSIATDGDDTIYADVKDFNLTVMGGVSTINNAVPTDIMDNDVAAKFENSTLTWGNDLVETNGGEDTIFGDMETGGIWVKGGQAILNNMAESETMTDARVHNVIIQMGDDMLDAGADNDLVYGDFKSFEFHVEPGTTEMGHYGEPVKGALDFTNNSITTGDDMIIGGTGNDVLYGDGDTFKLLLEEGEETIFTDNIIKFGDDNIEGGSGDDWLTGDVREFMLPDSNMLPRNFDDMPVLTQYLEWGNDELTGGSGDDTFAFNLDVVDKGDMFLDLKNAMQGHDTIVDLEEGETLEIGNVLDVNLSGTIDLDDLDAQTTFTDSMDDLVIDFDGGGSITLTDYAGMSIVGWDDLSAIVTVSVSGNPTGDPTL